MESSDQDGGSTSAISGLHPNFADDDEDEMPLAMDPFAVGNAVRQMMLGGGGTFADMGGAGLIDIDGDGEHMDYPYGRPEAEFEDE